MPILLPERLQQRWRLQPGGDRWLASLPSLIEECAERWQLRLGVPFEPGSVAWVAPVTTSDGSEAVLKLNFQELESEREPDALAHWSGQGAVRLLASDPARGGLLIERCRPGTQLWQTEDDAEATRIWANISRRLWRPAPSQHAFRLLAQEAARWAEDLPVMFESLTELEDRKMLDEAIEAIPALLATQGDPVVLHQDLHGGNVLQAKREPWLVIDPKPLVGEREFDTASFLRDRRSLLMTTEGASIVQRRLDFLALELGLDKQRMRLWGMVHALAWGMESGVILQRHLHAARLLWRAKV